MDIAAICEYGSTAPERSYSSFSSMRQAIRYFASATAISIVILAMPGCATAAVTATSQEAVARSSTELYAFDRPFADVLDKAQSMLMEKGTVGLSDPHAIGGEDKSGTYRYVITATPAKSPEKCYFTIDVSLVDDRDTLHTSTPRDESHAFTKELAERLGTIPIFVPDHK
ncbi:hypothetical protein PQR66_30790 [Paraburkholderia agricolaris]|uniref:Lipoprotein n=1 Tax=Paraburkholderia agricolaris TaxID=2152888 RepID=A0ABW8ZXI1_9BURK